MERQAKRLGDDVNQTTWKRLRSSLSAGLGKGEDIEQLSARVKKVYASATDSRARVIAQSEITRADTAGKLHTWKYAESKGVTRVIGKMWMSSFDDKVRDSHDAAHYQTVAPFDNFQVGNCEGPGPGLTGCPEEDVNCRCVAEAVFGDPPRSAGPQNLSRLLLSFDKETP